MTRKTKQTLAAILIAAFPLVILGFLAYRAHRDKAVGIPPENLQAVIAGHNRGVALMDQYRYKDAARAFREVTRLAPRWPVGHLNLGIALLNEQKHPEETSKALQTAWELDPESPRPPFCLAMLMMHHSQADAALQLLREVNKLEPRDADTLFWIGQVYYTKQEMEKAKTYYEKALAVNPFLSAAYRNLSLCQRVGEEIPAAQKSLETFQQLKEAGLGTDEVRAIQYPEMGRYAAIVRLGLPGEKTESVAKPGPRFVDITTECGIRFEHHGKGKDLASALASRSGAEIAGGGAVADFDSDGDMDIFLSDITPHGNRLFLNDGVGHFSDGTDKSGLAVPGTTLGAAIGDYDNDGKVDIYLLKDGPNQLFRNLGKVRFQDMTAPTATAGSLSPSMAAAFIDIDNDGDLDLFVSHLKKSGESPDRALDFFINRRDGKFVNRDDLVHLGSETGPFHGALFSDVDNDLDLDVLLFRSSGPPVRLDNQRLNGLQPGPASLTSLGPAGAGAAADVDGDERIDLALFCGPELPVRILQTGKDTGHAAAGQALPAQATNGAFFDADNDGDEDLFLIDARDGPHTSPQLFLNTGDGRWAKAGPQAGLDRIDSSRCRGALYADFDNDGDMDVLLTRNGGKVSLLRNDSPPANHSIQLLLQGIHDPGKMRSSALPIGAKVYVHSGRHHQRKDFLPSVGLLSQLSPRLTFGLGSRPKVDFIRIVWPDGLLQSEMEVASGKPVNIPEKYRKASSCPVLFAWNGERFEFITDFMGGGGLGFFLAPGLYARPQPKECVRMENHQLRPHGDSLELRILEPLEEVAYMDRIQLEVIDHPAGCEVYPDERFETGLPPRSGRIFTVKKRLFPLAARTGQTGNVLPRLLEADRRTVDDFQRDGRFIGYARPHELELNFGDQLSSAAAQGRVILYLYGWVEYPYSQTNFAAGQAGLRLRPPSLQVPDFTSGGWKTVLPEVGYPAGMSKMMTLDITRWAEECRGRLRVQTNMEIYWDAIFAAVDARAKLRRTAIPIRMASLRTGGFPREFSPDGRRPLLYDYTLNDSNPGFRLMAGNYTRFGEVAELLAATDDRFVILGRGDEVALSFDASVLPALADGQARTFLLHTDGFCKDMDPYTAGGQSVEPLPFHRMSNYPYPSAEQYPQDPVHQSYRENYNTRKVRVR